MKLLSITIAFFLFTKLSFAQDFDKIFNSLNLDPSIYKVEKDEIKTYINILGDTITEYESKVKGKVFNKIRISFDHDKEEMQYIALEFANEKKAFSQYLEFEEDLKSVLGEPYYSRKKIDNENYYFWDGNTFVDVIRLKNESLKYLPSPPEILIRNTSYEIQEEYNEFDKYSVLRVESYLPGIEIDDTWFHLNFKAIITQEKRFLVGIINCSSDNWRFMEVIQFMTPDGEVYEYDLNANRDVFSGGTIAEAGNFIIEKEILEKANSYKDLRIRIKGKYSYKIPFLRPAYKDMMVLGEEVYNMK
ncbi:hypothetical protein [Echinicola rosea]|uniref:DUF3857 domain-containing protein n=1 Tax=Echinicola rosea TaxID=1807691 RepID=A0ABQ1VBM8_9BACT|nr:hypothetical protein [Echinicola rosea]GGF49088.1 hypothetical protein GCM10011339_42140 [Echinicola rosea]